MLAFVRVFAFYVCTAALLMWGLFALGWADALEFPGFENSRTTTASIELPPKASLPRGGDVAPPAQAAPIASAPVVAPPATRIESVPQAAVPAVPPRLERPAPPPELPARVSDPVRRDPLSDSRSPPFAAPAEPAAQPRQSAAPVAAPSAPIPPSRVADAAPPPKAPGAVPVAPPFVRAPVPQQPAAPPVATPPRGVPPQAAPQAAPKAVPAPAPQVSRWAPTRRVAGFGLDALANSLDDARRGSGDVPCVVFQEVVFKAGTPMFAPRSRLELELISKVLIAHPEHRVEIGSRLGPGRPMASDARLRADRVRLVRDGLIALGVPADRLLLDQGEVYERVADDVARVAAVRRQSIGMCVQA